jgi:hypothetical protein
MMILTGAFSQAYSPAAASIHAPTHPRTHAPTHENASTFHPMSKLEPHKFRVDSFGSRGEVHAARPHASAHRGGGGADGCRGDRHDVAFNGNAATSLHHQSSSSSAPSSQHPRPLLSSASAGANGRAIDFGKMSRPPARAPQSAARLRAIASQISRSIAPSTQTPTSSQSGRGGRGKAGSRQASQKEPAVPWSGDFGDDDEVRKQHATGYHFLLLSPCSFLLHRAVTPTFPSDRCSCSTLNKGSRFCVGVDVGGCARRLKKSAIQTKKCGTG